MGGRESARGSRGRLARGPPIGHEVGRENKIFPPKPPGGKKKQTTFGTCSAFSHFEINIFSGFVHNIGRIGGGGKSSRDPICRCPSAVGYSGDEKKKKPSKNSHDKSVGRNCRRPGQFNSGRKGRRIDQLFRSVEQPFFTFRPDGFITGNPLDSRRKKNVLAGHSGRPNDQKKNLKRPGARSFRSAGHLVTRAGGSSFVVRGLAALRGHSSISQGGGGHLRTH